MDRQFSRRDAKPMGARGLRKTGTVSGPHSEMSEGMARKEAERYMYRAPAWGSTSNSTVEIEDVNARASSSETPPAHVILPSLYEGDSPQEEAPPSFLDSRLDPVYSLDSHFSDLSLNQRADTSRLQTPSIVEEDDVDDANEEQEHEYDDEDRNGAVQVLTDNRPIIVNTHSAPAIQGNFSVDASANDPNPVRPSLNPHQRYSLPVSMHQPASHSHSTFVPSAPPNFMEEGPRILPPAGLFDHKMAYGNQDHRSVPVSAFYNSTVGTSMMKLGAFQSKPTRDRTGGITVMPGSDRGMTPSLNSGVDPMSPPRSASPTISLRSTGNSTGTGVMVDGSNPHSPVSGGTSSPANSTLHGRTASAVFGGVPSFGRGMPSPHTPPNAYPPVPNRQPRVLAPLAPGFVPGQTQLGGNQHPNFTMSPNAVARPSGALLQGQFGQQGLPYAGQRNANLYGLDTGLGPWG
ncbi:uncharacterized protein EI90DRAFT_3022997 [Cantharellus anzutake]|uniref:uncharacterized protein n=1 Tax=Cantharellus anzutake TaxID=1750568 RepID=UPI0019083157|nr:uncharacterized protein EI90DRAFT_3022997 [Cantharellus anzutake]KAF8312559.1 hypothetical protein EI90DRAFT_3022997 [Cantharellus anzutake]